MSVRKAAACVAILGAMVVGAGALAAEQAANEDVVVTQVGFDPEDKQWMLRNDGKTRSDLRYEEGVLRYFPGPGSDSKGRVAWHGKGVSRSLALYGDYTIELKLAWGAASTSRGACRAFIEPRSGRAVPLYVIFHLDKRALEAKDSAQCVGYTDGLPESGRGTLRFERRGQVLRVLWEGRALAELIDDASATVDAFAVQFKNLPQDMPQAWIGLEDFRASVPNPGLQLTGAPIPGREEERQKLSAFAKETQELLKTLRDRTYKCETTLDVLGFDLNAVRDREEHAGLVRRVKAFGEKTRGDVERLRDSVAVVNRRVAGAVQFVDRVPSETLAKVSADADALKRGVADALKALDAAEEALRTELKGLRPAPATNWASNVEWARNRFHIYWFNHYGNVPPGYEDSLRYMNEMGSTSLQEWGYRGEGHQGSWEDYVAEWRRRLDLVGRESLRMFICPPGASVGHPHPDYRVATDETLAKLMAVFGDHPAFAGFEFDEIHFGNCWCRLCMPMFHEYLKKRFSHDELVGLGVIAARDDARRKEELLDQQIETILSDPPSADGLPPVKERKGKAEAVDEIGGPSADERSANPVLYTVRMEWRAQVFEESARAAFDRVRTLRPNVLIHTLLSPANFADFTSRDWGGPFGAPLYRMAALSDLITIDPYWNGVAEESYWCDLMRAHAKGPALLTVGTHYDARTPDSLERDLCIPFAHADGMYIFDWVSCFKQPPYNLSAAFSELWCPSGKWERVWSVAMKAKTLAPYLVRTESPHSLAMLHSMRSQSLEQHKGDLAGADPGSAALAAPGLYNMRQMGLYTLFRQARLQPDPMYAEGVTAAQLGRYRVLYIQNAVSMTPDEEAMIRSWVRNGGHLIATASTTLMDRWGRPQKDYGLADVFGVSYVGRKTLDKVTLAAQPEATYSGAVDLVQPSGGKVVLAWPDGSPAVVENPFGKGRCVFVTARDLGLNYRGENAGPERRCFNVYKTYSPGVIEFVRGMVTQELAAVDQPLPYAAENAPGEVEITVRLQPEDHRRVVHLLNYGYRTPVKGVTVSVPAGGGARAFYAVDDRPVELRRRGDAIEFVVRDFNVYEAIVVDETAQ